MWLKIEKEDIYYEFENILLFVFWSLFLFLLNNFFLVFFVVIKSILFFCICVLCCRCENLFVLCWCGGGIGMFVGRLWVLLLLNCWDGVLVGDNFCCDLKFVINVFVCLGCCDVIIVSYLLSLVLIVVNWVLELLKVWILLGGIGIFRICWNGRILMDFFFGVMVWEVSCCCCCFCGVIFLGVGDVCFLFVGGLIVIFLFVYVRFLLLGLFERIEIGDGGLMGVVLVDLGIRVLFVCEMVFVRGIVLVFKLGVGFDWVVFSLVGSVVMVGSVRDFGLVVGFFIVGWIFIGVGLLNLVFYENCLCVFFIMGVLLILFFDVVGFVGLVGEFVERVIVFIFSDGVVFFWGGFVIEMLGVLEGFFVFGCWLVVVVVNNLVFIFFLFVV